MKRQQFNIPLPPSPRRAQVQIVSVEDGRKNKILQDECDILSARLKNATEALARTGKRQKELLSNESQLSILNHGQADELSTLRSVRKQLESEVTELNSLRTSWKNVNEARKLAEFRLKNIQLSTSNMSQGAIIAQGGEKVAMFGPIIPRKHLGGGAANLVKYSVKENN
jgi:hypothetical protein